MHSLKYQNNTRRADKWAQLMVKAKYFEIVQDLISSKPADGEI